MARTGIHVECVAWYESEVGRVDLEDLVLWGKALPEGARIHHDIPQTHGKLHLKATWIEDRAIAPQDNDQDGLFRRALEAFKGRR